LDDLLPQVRTRVDAFIAACEDQGIDLLVTSTYRDFDSQAALYAQGRTAAGRRVTNAPAGHSYHNYRCAIDVVPLINGKPNWNTKNPVWQQLGQLGADSGLEWAGHWRSFPEYAHFQYTGGLAIAALLGGATIA
jgi:peptidoglycan L-alanyl-D-glutamate endopeptidase CwlK